MTNPTSKSPKKRANGSSVDRFSPSGLPLFEEDDVAFKVCFEILLARPTPQMNLPDWLWRHESDLVYAINRGHTAREMWALFKQKMPRFAYSYRTFARALAEFRRAKELPPAYGTRKSQVAATPKIAAFIVNSTSGHAETPQPVPSAPAQVSAKNMSSVMKEDQGEETSRPSGQALPTSRTIKALLDERFPPQYNPDIPSDMIEISRTQNLQMREARAKAAVDAEIAEAAERRRCLGR